MADALVGTTTVREWRLLWQGAPRAGQVVRYSLWDPHAQLVLADALAANAGQGYYQVTVAGALLDEPGAWRERWLAPDGAGAGRAVQEERYLLVGPAGPHRRTLREVRWQVAALLDDLWEGVATGGTATTLLDPERIEPDDHWRGAWLYIYAGTNRYEERRVSTSIAGTLTVGRAFSAAPDGTSRYELHRRFRVEDYNSAINLAIQQVAHRALLPVTDESLVQTTATEYEAPLPLALVARVFTGSEASGWTELRAQRGEWTTLPGKRRLVLKSPQAGQRLRLVGSALPQLAARDDTWLDVSPDYLTFKAAAHLASRGIASPQVDRDAAYQVANFFHAQAEAVRPASFGLPGSRRL